MAIGNMGLDGENGHQIGLKGEDKHCKPVCFTTPDAPPLTFPHQKALAENNLDTYLGL
jgi:hypothetical protein